MVYSIGSLSFSCMNVYYWEQIEKVKGMEMEVWLIEKKEHWKKCMEKEMWMKMEIEFLKKWTENWKYKWKKKWECKVNWVNVDKEMGM